MMPINQIPAAVTQTVEAAKTAVAQKLDDSPRIVWNWRYVWKTTVVRINAFGAALSFLLGALTAIAPLLGVVWAASWPLRISLTLTFVLCVSSVIARYTAQPNLPGTAPATPPPDDTDDKGDAGELPK